MARAPMNSASWNAMVEKATAATSDWKAVRKETSETMATFQDLHSGEAGDRVVALRQRDYWALLDMLAVASGRITVALEIERQLSERLDALEDAAAKSPPGAVYRGVFKPEHQYAAGDLVTHAGGLWHANRPTEKRPGDGVDWTLAVKRGRAESIHIRGAADEHR